MLCQCHSSGVRLHNDYFSLYTNKHADPLLEGNVADKDECYCRRRRISLNNIHFLSVFANKNGLVGPSPFFRSFRHWIRPLLANSLNEQRVRVVGLVDDVLYCVCVALWLMASRHNMSQPLTCYTDTEPPSGLWLEENCHICVFSSFRKFTFGRLF